MAKLLTSLLARSGQRTVSALRIALFGTAEYRPSKALAEHMALFESVVAQNPNQIDFDRLLATVSKVGLLVTRPAADSQWQNLLPLFTGKTVVCLGEPGWDSADVYFVVGIGFHARPALEWLRSRGAPCFVVEETFLKSVLPGSMYGLRPLPPELFRAVAYVIDAKGPAFYPKPTQLERDIASDTVVTDAEARRARKLIAAILEHQVSKYNCLPPGPIRRSSGPLVLVIDQAYRDFSVALSAGDDAFPALLSCAMAENPAATIVVRSHIDRFSRETYFSRHPLPPGVILNTEPINPIAMLQAADKVYTFSSTMGWEALMCGKEVHTFGSPIYAGWGLTRDRRNHPARRTAKRSVEELFHFLYIRNSRYIDPETSCPCEIERAIECLIAGRERYLREFSPP